MKTLALHKLSTSDPADVSGLQDMPLDAQNALVAVLGKTEGNGCVNDFTRGMAASAWKTATTGNPITVMSGGTEGILSPHVTLLSETEEDPHYPHGALVIGAGSTANIHPRDLGKPTQAYAVAEEVRNICRRIDVDPKDISFAVAKCPLLTSDQIAAHHQEQLAATDTYESMGSSRAASALGIALATGEINEVQLDAALKGDLSYYSSVASASAGVEVSGCEIVVLANSPKVRGPLRATTVVMKDALDAGGIVAALAEISEAGGKVVHLYAKAEADPAGRIRGQRHTMLTDSDINSTRHARAAVGGLLAGLVGDSAIYVSGGSEHQGPPGGGPVTVVWEASKES